MLTVERSAGYPLAYNPAPPHIGGESVVGATGTAGSFSEEREAWDAGGKAYFLLKDAVSLLHDTTHLGRTPTSHISRSDLWVRIVKRHGSPDLLDALRDLDEAREEAREEEFPIPSNAAMRNARWMVRAIYEILPRRFEVYPTSDGEIAVYVPGAPKRSILLLCDSDGGVLCMVNVNGRHRRARYPDAKQLPDGFMHEALDELKRQSRPSG